MSDALIEARDLSLTFPLPRGVKPLRPALSHVSVRVGRGEIVGIVGESGSGKTTLGRCLLNLVRPTSGQVFFEGREITALPEAEMRPLRRRMQMIFQDPMSCLNPRHTIRRILAEPLILHGLAPDRRAAEREVEAVLGRVGLDAVVLGRYPHELSGGQRQRIGIARAAVLKPSFILADEIVSGLDVSTQAQTLNLIKGLVDEMGLSMAFISHDLSVIRAVCSRVVVMRGGEVTEEGPTREVFRSPKAAYTRTLLDAIPPVRPDPAWLSAASV
ncbi:ATP-binding cassette domain-containing protein [Aureimonas ureilytica]|uniref:ATP-binding cassette domain-containing protein n=1 Tax=Aureimonas ureilytica TaxID=401562 RepID=UPI00037EED17|nr:ABC transporter ATP-binding protein [Aureimonas ureilytica]